MARFCCSCDTRRADHRPPEQPSPGVASAVCVTAPPSGAVAEEPSTYPRRPHPAINLRRRRPGLAALVPVAARRRVQTVAIATPSAAPAASTSTSENCPDRPWTDKLVHLIADRIRDGQHERPHNAASQNTDRTPAEPPDRTPANSPDRTPAEDRTPADSPAPSTPPLTRETRAGQARHAHTSRAPSTAYSTTWALLRTTVSRMASTPPGSVPPRRARIASTIRPLSPDDSVAGCADRVKIITAQASTAVQRTAGRSGQLDMGTTLTHVLNPLPRARPWGTPRMRRSVQRGVIAQLCSCDPERAPGRVAIAHLCTYDPPEPTADQPGGPVSRSQPRSVQHASNRIRSATQAPSGRALAFSSGSEPEELPDRHRRPGRPTGARP